MTIEADDDVACQQTGLACRSIVDNIGNQCAAGAGKSQRFSNVRRDAFKGGADIGAFKHLATVFGGLDHGADKACRNGKADAVRSAGSAENSGVDAHQATVHVDQCATGIARIDCRVRLNKEAEIGNADTIAGNSRDNAAGYGLADSKRIADGKREITNLDGIGVAKLDDRERAFPINFQNSEIETLILEQNPALKLAAVGKGYTDIIRPLDNVIVGNDDAVALHHHTGAQRRLFLGAVGHGLAEEPFEKRISRKRRHAALNQTVGVDIDDGWCCGFHQWREGQHHARLGARHFTLGLCNPVLRWVGLKCCLTFVTLATKNIAENLADRVAYRVICHGLGFCRNKKRDGEHAHRQQHKQDSAQPRTIWSHIGNPQ